MPSLALLRSCASDSTLGADGRPIPYLRSREVKKSISARTTRFELRAATERPLGAASRSKPSRHRPQNRLSDTEAARSGTRKEWLNRPDVLGIVVTVLFNVNSLHIATELWSQPQLQAAVTAEAQAATSPTSTPSARNRRPGLLTKRRRPPLRHL